MSRELELLAKKHLKWVGYVINMGGNESFAEDIVQDAYLRCLEYLNKGVNIDYGDEDVNDYYFYMVLRSVFVNSMKKKGLDYYIYPDEVTMDRYLYNISAEIPDIDQEEGHKRLIKGIFKEVNTWESYHQTLFVAYFTSGLSLDKLSEATGIGRSSLYNSVRKYREVVKDMFDEDVQDYYNGDYDKIK